MLAIPLPMLPPPATSLLPPLHDRLDTETSNGHDGQNSLQARQQRRTRGHPHAMYPRSELAMLSYDERLLAQRKLAISMYGYSWLKPAGCTKTMLGRREEDFEREEVERQLREVELQERNAAEMEESETQARRAQQAAREARGEDVGEEGERDLDEEVPDMDAQDEFEDEDSEEEEDVGDVDLDDEVPEADNSWAYDTTRDPDTDTEDEEPSSLRRPRNLPQARGNMLGNAQPANRREHPYVDLSHLNESMLDDNEMGDYPPDHDLDDGVPDMDGSPRDLDDEIPDADEDDGGWEHTDTELEESDMDISIMPPGVIAHHQVMPPHSHTSQDFRSRVARQIAESQNSGGMSSGLRRTSGNIPLPMGPPAQPTTNNGARRGLPRTQNFPPNYTPDQIGSDFSVSALISTGNTDVSSDSGAAPPQRSWLDPASARRNLFGGSRNVPVQSGNASSSQQPAHSNLRMEMGAPRQVSNGGLFTPSPNVQRQQQEPGEEPRSRTRSGRATGRVRSGRGV